MINLLACIYQLFCLSAIWIENPAVEHQGTWGFQPHQLINRYAVFTLPPDMITFYKHHLNYISTQAVAPDRRRYAVASEGAKHYIDLDYYGLDVPRQWNQLLQNFPRDSIQEHGVLPWHLLSLKSALVKAFEKMDQRSILRISADAGHYLADAHVPLHTTSNYNGQYTGQHGIHGFWETRVPELLVDTFDLWVGKAHYHEHWYVDLWDAILVSHHMVDSVLREERTLTSQFPEHLKYSYEIRLKTVVRGYSRKFTERFHQGLNKQVERRMRAAIKAVGDFWYTCWVDSGQPDLPAQSVDIYNYSSDYQKFADSLWRYHRINRK